MTDRDYDRRIPREQRRGTSEPVTRINRGTEILKEDKRMPNDRSQFLYESIRDIQSTIRALDVKTNYLMVMLIIPIVKLASIFSICHYLWNASFVIFVIPVTCFCLSWMLAITSAFRALVAIGNPVTHIAGVPPRGYFYAGRLFSLKWVDVFFNRPNLSKFDFRQHLADAPQLDSDIIKELVFEQMKLVFIRDIKMLRSRTAYFFTTIWILFGGILWIARIAVF